MTRFSSMSFSALALVLALSAASSSSASIFDTIKSKVDEITNAVSDKVDSAKNAIADNSGSVKDAVADKLDSAKNAVSDAAVSVKNAVADKVDAAKNVLSAKCPPSGFDSVANFSLTAYASAPWYPQKQVRSRPLAQTHMRDSHVQYAPVMISGWGRPAGGVPMKTSMASIPM